jgi:hypothetical protein
LKYSDLESVEITINNEPPVCTITYPIKYDVVFGTIVIHGTVNDTLGKIEKVELQIDDGDVIQIGQDFNWSYIWNTRTFEDGEHSVYVKAYDGLLYSDTVSFIYSVNNKPPICEFTSHSSGDKVRGSVLFKGNSITVTGTLEKIEYRIDNGEWTTIEVSTLWFFYWNSEYVDDGEHDIAVRAFNGISYSDYENSTISVYVLNDETATGVGNSLWDNRLFTTSVLIIIFSVMVILFSFLFIRKKRKELTSSGILTKSTSQPSQQAHVPKYIPPYQQQGQAQYSQAQYVQQPQQQYPQQSQQTHYQPVPPGSNRPPDLHQQPYRQDLKIIYQSGPRNVSHSNKIIFLHKVYMSMPIYRYRYNGQRIFKIHDAEGDIRE